MKRIDLANYVAALAGSRHSYQAKYFAMYSSQLDGLVMDPVLMQLPVDDHLVHRGDGVFETCKCVAGAIYLFDAHLLRLEHSAATIGIRWPAGMAAVRRLTLETVQAAAQRDCSIRIILSRGPGSFGVSPYDSPLPALYIVVYGLGRPFMDLHPAGATVGRSTIPAKPAEMAAIKNCNYLPNVLMKREAVDRGVDFVVGYDARGCLTEGPTENIGMVTCRRELVFPRLENILAGTTMLRLVELARPLLNSGVLRTIEFRDILEEEVRTAAELLIVGTTLNVVAVRSYEGQTIGDGCPGPIWRQLQTLLEDDILHTAAVRTAGI
ncbi:MAG: aminotransferase class IV [Kiritimatiellia bacterium]